MKTIQCILYGINGPGGQAIVSRKVIKLLRERNHDVLLYDLKPKLVHDYFLYFKLIILSLFQKKKVTVYFTPTRSKKFFLKDLPMYIYAFRNFKVVAHIHGNDLENLFQGYTGAILLALYKHKITCIVPSNYLRAKYSGELDIKTFTVNNYYLSTINLQDTNVKSLIGKRIIWNSNLYISKGGLDFLELLLQKKEIINSYNYKVEVFGEINDSRVKQKCDLCVSEVDEFRYYGVVSRAEILDYLDQSSIVCLLSRSECQPLALIDAMCHGAFIICMNIPELTDLLADYPKRIFLDPSDVVPEVDFTAISKYIDECIVDVTFFRKKFSEESFNQSFLEVIREN